MTSVTREVVKEMVDGAAVEAVETLANRNHDWIATIETRRRKHDDDNNVGTLTPAQETFVEACTSRLNHLVERILLSIQTVGTYVEENDIKQRTAQENSDNDAQPTTTTRMMRIV
jgi:hypothetical protein